jgi:threonine dehydratase
MGRTSAVNIPLEEVRLIGERDRRIVTHTPVAPSAHLSERYGGAVVLKAENLQRTGAFKIRGAMNKLATLGESARRGVVAGSAGNHAGALAFAAREFGVPCEIYVPAGASLSKIAACRGYGATVHEGGESLDVAVALAQARANETGMVFCHPYDDPVVVAGQATLGVELIDDIPDLAQVIVPLGGGGLLSGVALTVKQFDPSIKVIGVQISSCAPYMYGKAPLGPVPTLADGIAVKVPGDVTAPLIEKWVDDIVDVDEDSVADAMMLLLERSKLFVEGGGAVGVSALIAGRIKPAERGTTCVVLSGGNADLGLLTGLVRRHETNSGRRLIVFARISDRPGGLARLLTVFAQHGANLIEVEHVREGVDLHVRETGVQVVLEVRGRDHTETLIAVAKAEGYEISEVTGR